MAKQSTSGGIQLTHEEVVALRTIVSDWINEGIVTPPYDEPTTSAIAKLRPDKARASSRATAASDAGADRDEQTEPVVLRPTPNLG